MINLIDNLNIMRKGYKFMSTSRFNVCKNEHGTTMLEFTIVLSILLTFTFAMIDFGRYVYTANVIRSAAQEGARAGLVDLSTVENAVEDNMVMLDTSRVGVTVSQPNEETVEVDVTYQFEFITPIIAAMVPSGTFQIAGSASMIAY
ncbi:MAG: pilus assembly protein [Caldilineaceae bacterium]